MDERTNAAIERMRAAKACPKHYDEEAPEAHWYGFGGLPGTPSAPCDDCAALALHAGVGQVTVFVLERVLSAVAAELEFKDQQRMDLKRLRFVILAVIEAALREMIGEPPETER